MGSLQRRLAKFCRSMGARLSSCGICLRKSSRKHQPRYHLWVKRLIVLLLGLLLLRSLPYLAPIRSAELVQKDQAIEFRDRNNLFLGTLLTRDQEHTAVVPLKQVSPLFLQAIVAAEDRNFWRHGATDPKAVVRAVWQGMQAMRIVSGASTITMQLARMIQPTPATLWGKAREVWLAWRLDAGMTRSEVLQAYVNRLPMGGNIYGVEAAARVYFGVGSADLNLAQAGLLAAIPNDPNYFNPYKHWERLKRRQQYVLNQMRRSRLITTAQIEQTRSEVVALQPRHQGIVAAPHFLFWQAGQLADDHPAQMRTSLDLPLQQFVEGQVLQVLAGLAENNVRQAAAIVLENQTGNVLAYVGSRDYFAEGGMNDGVQALRQPGSTLKPFLYELALEKRVIRPNTILADVPTYYAIPGAQLYRPVDYSETFQGPVRVRIALANSLNIPAVRVLEKVGVAEFLDRLHQLGFKHLDKTPEHYGLGLTLGSGEVSLWELAQAYRVMALGGQSERLQPVNYGGYGAATWPLVADILADRHARAKSFGVDSVLNLPFAAAVKTGTSSDFRDTWTVGVSRDYTVATWVGNFDGAPMRQVSGIVGAAPLWSRIMLRLHERSEPEGLPAPIELVKKPICVLSGLRPGGACPVVQEYFYPEDLGDYARQVDTVYGMDKDGQVRLNLPPEYDEWLAMQRENPLGRGKLRIVSPRGGDYFLVRSGAGQQRLAFRLADGGSGEVAWWLNGRRIGAGNEVFWDLQPGDWRLQVRQGAAMDEVRFQVRAVDGKEERRGFSSIGP
jgi:penicillin-binding protein 1C